MERFERAAVERRQGWCGSGQGLSEARGAPGSQGDPLFPVGAVAQGGSQLHQPSGRPLGAPAGWGEALGQAVKKEPSEAQRAIGSKWVHSVQALRSASVLAKTGPGCGCGRD